MVKPPHGVSGGLPRTGHLTFARPALPGDYCILLAPAQDNHLARLRKHQMDLQMMLGGRLPEPTHLTCNRFEAAVDHLIDTGHPEQAEPRVLGRLRGELANRLANTKPFTLKPLAYLPQYSPLRFVHILKWQVESDENLRRMHRLIEDALDAARCLSLYPKGWVSTLVTALEDIQQIKLNPQAVSVPLCDPLFTVGEVLITHIRAKDDFKVVARLPIPE